MVQKMFSLPPLRWLCLAVLVGQVSNGLCGERLSRPPQTLPQGVSYDWYQNVSHRIRLKEYQFSQESAGVWSAPNRAQGFRVSGHNRGISIRPRQGGEGRDSQSLKAWSVSLYLTRLGRFYDLKKVKSGEIQVEKNRLELTHGFVSQWYINGQEGLEQGFTVFEPPAQGKTNLPLILEIKVEGAAAPVLDEKGNILLTDSKGRVLLNYEKLNAWDAEGRVLPATFQLASRKSFQIRVEDEGAVYPLTVDPMVTNPRGGGRRAGKVPSLADPVPTMTDLNGDGYSDIILGAVGYDHGEAGRGVVFVYWGGPEGFSESPSKIMQLQ